MNCLGRVASAGWVLRQVMVAVPLPLLRVLT